MASDIHVGKSNRFLPYWEKSGLAKSKKLSEAVLIEDASREKIVSDVEEALKKEGWSVKIKPARNVDEEPFITLPIKVLFNEMGPNVFLNSGGKITKLDEHSIHRLDRISIASVSMDVRPYDWTVNGKTGRKAYLSSMEVEQNIDRFSMKYEGVDDEVPFEE